MLSCGPSKTLQNSGAVGRDMTPELDLVSTAEELIFVREAAVRLFWVILRGGGINCVGTGGKCFLGPRLSCRHEPTEVTVVALVVPVTIQPVVVLHIVVVDLVDVVLPDGVQMLTLVEQLVATDFVQVLVIFCEVLLGFRGGGVNSVVGTGASFFFGPSLILGHVPDCVVVVAVVVPVTAQPVMVLQIVVVDLVDVVFPEGVKTLTLVEQLVAVFLIHVLEELFVVVRLELLVRDFGGQFWWSFTSASTSSTLACCSWVWNVCRRP